MGDPPVFQRLLSQNSAKRRRQFELSKPITPFVSSTFIDFQDEREYLVKKVFPQLNMMCSEKGSRFDALDLRWGINASQKDKGYLIQNCLDYVRHCSPYFICLLGERYGSHRPPKMDLLPPNLDSLPSDADWLTKNLVVAAVTGNYSFILNNTDNHFASITELEITYRLTLQNTHGMYFYLRKPIDFDQYPEERRAEMKEKFGSESEYAANRLKNLKRRIRSYVPLEQVHEYSTLEELGQLVFNDWANIIQNEFFNVSVSSHAIAHEMYQEWQAHASFQETYGDSSRYYRSLNSKLEMTVDQEVSKLTTDVSSGFPSEDSIARYRDCLSLLNRTTLDGYKEEQPGQILAVRAGRGIGKSAFLANVSKNREDLPKTFNCSGLKMFCHFVGCNSQSEDLSNFISRYNNEMTEFFIDSNPANWSRGADEHKCEVDQFHAALCFGPSVIFLDGIDHFTSSTHFSLQEVKNLSWLPSKLPPGCLIVLSTTYHDLTCRSLAARSDVTFLDLVSPSTAIHKSEILSCHLGPRKKLEEHQRARILACDLSESPLFLSAVAKELQLCGGYLSVDKQIDKYIGCGSLRTLWELIISRWAADYGWALPHASVNSRNDPGSSLNKSSNKSGSGSGSSEHNWVIDVLRLLCLSRNGLSQDHLIECLHAIGYSSPTHSVGTFDLMQFRSCAQEAIQTRRNGQLYVKHSVVREAINYAFLYGVCPEMTSLKQPLVAPVVAQNSNAEAAVAIASVKGINARLKYQNVIVDHLLSEEASWVDNPDLLRELLWQLANTGNTSKLAKLLTSVEKLFEGNVAEGSHAAPAKHSLLEEVKGYWEGLLMKQGHSPGSEYTHMVNNIELYGGRGGPGAAVTLTGEPPDVRSFVTTPAPTTPLAQRHSITLAIAPTEAQLNLSDPEKQKIDDPTPDRVNLSELDIILPEMEAGGAKRQDSSISASSLGSPSGVQRELLTALNDGQSLSLLYRQVANLLEDLQCYPEAEYVLKKAYDQQTKFTERSAEESSQLQYIDCVIEIGSVLEKQFRWGRDVTTPQEPSPEDRGEGGLNAGHSITYGGGHETGDLLEESKLWFHKALDTLMILTAVCAGEGTIVNKLRAKQGRVMVELANISLTQGNFNEAISNLEVTASDGLLPDNNPYYLRLLYCKAKIWHKQMKFEESQATYEKVLKLFSERYGPNHHNLADVLISFADLLSDKHFLDGFNYFLAEDYYQRALKLKLKHLGARHLDVAECKEKLGRLMLSNQKLNSSRYDAFQHLIDAIDIKKIVLGPEKVKTGKLENYLVNIGKTELRKRGKTPPDNLLDEDLTIPPESAAIAYVWGKDAIPAPAPGKQPPRPASALSWNDRDLVHLQQRKNRAARKELQKRREDLGRSAGLVSAAPTQRSAVTTIGGFTEIDGDEFVTLEELEISKLNTSMNKAPKSAFSRSHSAGSHYSRRHRRKCEVPDKFAINPHSVHGPYSTLNSLILFKPSIVTRAVSTRKKAPGTVSGVSGGGVSLQPRRSWPALKG